MQAIRNKIHELAKKHKSNVDTEVQQIKDLNADAIFHASYIADITMFVNKYKEIIIKYKRFFLAFPRLLFLNAGILNRDVRGILNERISILNDRINKIKVEIKSRFQT